MNEKLLLKQVEEASFYLQKEKVVCFPTETVMGLGVIFDSENAYNLLNKIKRRPEDKPYTLMCKDVETMLKFGVFDANILKVISAFIPGSLTILVKAKEGLPFYVTHGKGVIGLRVPTNDEALKLLENINKPLLVPSANRSGEDPALNSNEAKDIFGDEVSYYINGEAKKERPSTIIDFSKGSPILLREGPISFGEILKVYNGND